MGGVGGGVAAHAEGEHVAAGAVAEAVALVPAADALSAFDAEIGVDEDLDFRAGHFAGEDVAAGGGFVASGELDLVAVHELSGGGELFVFGADLGFADGAGHDLSPAVD